MSGKNNSRWYSGILVSGMLLAALQGNALASEQRTTVASGHVYFSGQIYEPACKIQVAERNVTSACFQQGNTQQQSLNVSSNEVRTFNQNRTRSQMSWLDSAQRLGLLTVSYR